MTATVEAPWLSEESLNEIATETATGNYVNPSKLEADKQHRFRIVGQAITGFESWTTAKKPVRWRMRPPTEDLPGDIKLNDSGAPEIKRFVATIVWDYQSESFKILQVTQKTILKQINKYTMDTDYGDPQGYDLKMTRTGSGTDTEYAVLAAPPKPISKEIAAAFKETTINLEALFENGDPFAAPAKD